MKSTVLVAIAVMAAMIGHAHAQNIYTGGPNGAYHSNFCPPLAKELGLAYYNMTCTTSAGTGENVAKVLADPKSLGFGQFDVVALMATQDPSINQKLQIVRDDIAKECLFVITNNVRLISIDDLSRFASRVPFILPPEKSGSAASFKLLQTNDPDGLGRAHNVTFANSTDEMVKQVLDSPNAVGLFVQLPDPSNAIFKGIGERHGRFVSVVNKKILAIKVADRPVYEAIETDVHGISVVHPEGGRLTTACTPTVVFTGKPDLFPEGSNERKDQSDLIQQVQSIDRTKLLPAQAQEGQASAAWSWFRKKASVVSESALDGIEKAAEAARKKLAD